MKAEIYDHRICELGEGPLWHPERGQLFWFDILGNTLLSRDGDTELDWRFDEHVSAAGWLSKDALLIASETKLFTFNLTTETQETVIDLEHDQPLTRSNDGRADPWGGFWIGTMGKQAEPGLGAIYRLFRGELRKLFAPITIPNAICFAPDQSHAVFTDTASGQVMRVALHPETGWPEAAPEIALDLTQDALNPDGAVIDISGNLWLAEWGSARVAVYDPAGTRIKTISANAVQTSCPAFGGPDLYITSAAVWLGAKAGPDDGKTFICRGAGQGQTEHRVVL